MSEIRVRNDTGESLDDVRVTPAVGDPVSLGSLPPGDYPSPHKLGKRLAEDDTEG